jgi:hypothetical protein
MKRFSLSSLTYALQFFLSPEMPFSQGSKS